MANLSVRQYTTNDLSIWNDLVSKSKQATFLFHRDFMEYHQDRFTDHSLLISKGDKVVAVFPAHQEGKRLCSHMGLTYGGIMSAKADTAAQLDYFEAILQYSKIQGFEELYMKFVPSFLQEEYSSAVEFAVFQKGAKLLRRDLNFVVDLNEPLAIHKSKMKKLNALEGDDYRIIQTSDFKAFWKQLLIPVLKATYNTNPVHTLEEIEKLGATFPDNIIQYNVEWQGELVAGMTLFIDRGVVKSQYGVNSELGKESRALDYLYWRLMEQYQELGFRYFDMGTTTDAKGGMNLGLTRYKEEFGARPMNLDQYLLPL